MPNLTQRTLNDSIQGFGTNAPVVIQQKDGSYVPLTAVSLNNGKLVLHSNWDTSSVPNDKTQQEAGAIKPTTEEVLNNNSGISFAASGSNRGSNGPEDADKTETNKVNENAGTELGSGAIISGAANKDNAALPVTPQSDAGATTTTAAPTTTPAPTTTGEAAPGPSVTTDGSKA